MGLDHFMKAISLNGGWVNSFITFFRKDSVKFGNLVGVDRYGNKYYENSFFFVGRNRWVIYADHFGFNYDGSQVENAWFRWLHQMTDILPGEENKPQHRWILPHTENMTGTKFEYVPYSTTKPKIIPWSTKAKPVKPPC